jgi:preprotein translocase subunit Sec61beta
VLRDNTRSAGTAGNVAGSVVGAGLVSFLAGIVSESESLKSPTLSTNTVVAVLFSRSAIELAIGSSFEFANETAIE